MSPGTERFRNWKTLRELTGETDTPPFIWGIAEETAAGHLPAGYQDGLGCG